jgi:hypothetical protein
MPLGPPVRVAQWVNPNPSHTWARSAHSPLSSSRRTLIPLALSRRCGRLAAAASIRPPLALPAGEVGANRAAARRRTFGSASIWRSPPFLLAPNPAAPQSPGSVKIRHSPASLAPWRRRDETGVAARWWPGLAWPGAAVSPACATVPPWLRVSASPVSGFFSFFYLYSFCSCSTSSAAGLLSL